MVEPVFGRPDSPFLRLWDAVPRAAKRVGMVLVVVAVVAALYFHLFVAPELTARRYEMWWGGSDDRVTVAVDAGTMTVSIGGGQGSVTRLRIVGDTLFVPAEEVGIAGAGSWVAVPVGLLELSTAEALTVAAARGLGRDVKDCAPAGPGTQRLLALVLPPVSRGNDVVSVCSSTIGAAAADGTAVLVKTERIRPSSVDGMSGEVVVRLEDLPDSAAVLLEVERLLRT